RRRHTRFSRDWSSDVCSSDLTDYSGRQDWGVRHNLSEYFLCYQWMAEHDCNPLFAAMYDLAAAALTHLGPVNNHALLGSMCYPRSEERRVGKECRSQRSRSHV